VHIQWAMLKKKNLHGIKCVRVHLDVEVKNKPNSKENDQTNSIFVYGFTFCYQFNLKQN